MRRNDKSMEELTWEDFEHCVKALYLPSLQTQQVVQKLRALRQSSWSVSRLVETWTQYLPLLTDADYTPPVGELRLMFIRSLASSKLADACDAFIASTTPSPTVEQLMEHALINAVPIPTVSMPLAQRSQ